ncbi:MAG: T9SS type A sorting domain-containing protein, partial [Bacteroidota bacterium]
SWYDGSDYEMFLYVHDPTVVSVNEASKPAHERFALSQNYPNPFNPTTEIRFQISEVRGQKSENSHVTLKVYDLLGQEVATLVNEELKPGSYEVGFAAKELASGVYFYILRAREFLSTKRMLLIK